MAEIRTANFEVEYLLQFYQSALVIGQQALLD